MRRSVLLAVLLFCTPFGASCVSMVTNQTADVLEVAAPAFNTEPDVQFAREAAPGQIKTVEGFLRASPENEILIKLLADGYCSYAFGFVESDYEDAVRVGKDEDAAKLAARATGFYQRCKGYGLRLLGDGWAESLDGNVADFEKRVAEADDDDVPGLFWTAFGLASAINLNRDDIMMVADLPKAKAMLERVVQLDERYHQATAHTALGMMKSAQSKALGGDPDAARKHFERADELNGGKFLMAKVLKAYGYAVSVQDQPLFQKTLEEVLATEPAVNPEQRLANELAHIRARRYLAQSKELF